VPYSGRAFWIATATSLLFLTSFTTLSLHHIMWGGVHSRSIVYVHRATSASNIWHTTLISYTIDFKGSWNVRQMLAVPIVSEIRCRSSIVDLLTWVTGNVASDKTYVVNRQQSTISDDVTRAVMRRGASVRNCHPGLTVISAVDFEYNSKRCGFLSDLNAVISPTATYSEND